MPDFQVKDRMYEFIQDYLRNIQNFSVKKSKKNDRFSTFSGRLCISDV